MRKIEILAVMALLAATLGAQAAVEFAGGENATATTKTYTIADVTGANPTVTGTAGTATGSFTSGSGSLSITVSALAGYTNAVAMTQTNNFSAYVATLANNVFVDSQVYDWGVDSVAFQGDTDKDRINGNEVLVITFDTSGLTGQLSLNGFNRQTGGLTEYADYILFDPVSNTVDKAAWAKSGNGDFAFTSPISDGAQFLVAANNNLSIRIQSLNLEITLPSGSINVPPILLPPIAGNSLVELDWEDDPSSALLDHYNVYRSLTTNEVDFVTPIASVTNSEYSDSNVTNGITYYYMAAAVSTGGVETAFGNLVSSTPSIPVPTGLETDAGNANVVLTWDASADALFADFTIYRTTTEGVNHTAIASNLVENTYTDTTVSNGILYYYVVTHHDLNGGESDFGNEDSAMPQATITTLHPVADAYVRDGTSAANNYGSENALEIKESSVNFTRRTYLRFDVSSVTGGVSSAVLRLKLQSGSGVLVGDECREITWVVVAFCCLDYFLPG